MPGSRWARQAERRPLNTQKSNQDIITSTPWRILFFGGGTDYPVFVASVQGRRIGRTSAVISLVDVCGTSSNTHSRISYSKVENVHRYGVIEHPSVGACLRFGVDEGVEIHHVADTPPAATEAGVGYHAPRPMRLELRFLRRGAAP